MPKYVTTNPKFPVPANLPLTFSFLPQFGTSNTKEEFIQGLPYVPSVPSIDTMDVFHLCTKVLWRWRFNLSPLPVRGMNVFQVNPVSKQIEINYVEFNSAVWMYDMGYTGCKPNATTH
jgi:hypothetical protein